MEKFFDKSQPDWDKPKFKSKKAPRQGFKTDRAKIINGKLRLDKPINISKDNWFDLASYEALKMNQVKVISIFKENETYYAALSYEEKVTAKTKTHQKTAVDVNVGHFNYTEGQINVLPAKLQKLYKRIKHYQRMLARKIANIQNDLLQKFTTKLVNNYDQIVIEDLAIQKMMMTHVASKGMQRSLFSRFRQILTYKCEWYSKKINLS